MKLKIALMAPRIVLMAALYEESDLRSERAYSSPLKEAGRRGEVRQAYQWSKESRSEAQKSL